MTKNYESEYQVRLQLIREANNVEVKHQKINNYNNNNKKDPE